MEPETYDVLKCGPRTLEFKILAVRRPPREVDGLSVDVVETTTGIVLTDIQVVWDMDGPEGLVAPPIRSIPTDGLPEFALPTFDVIYNPKLPESLTLYRSVLTALLQFADEIKNTVRSFEDPWGEDAEFSEEGTAEGTNDPIVNNDAA